MRLPLPVRVHPRSLWDWSCDTLAVVLVGLVFRRVPYCPCGDEMCTEEHCDG